MVAGDQDEFHPLDVVVQLSRWLPNAELAILPGSSHMRPISEPEMLAPVLVDFLGRQ